MYKKCAIIALTLIFAVQTVSAAEVLYPIWNSTLKGNLPDRVDVEYVMIQDINGDDINNIYVVTSGNPAVGSGIEKNKLFIYEGNGSLLWAHGIDYWIRYATSYDLDRDGLDEILVSAGQEYQGIERGRIYLYDERGRVLNIFKDNAVYTRLGVGDLNDDQYYEIVAGANRKAILLGAGFEKYWRYPLPGTGLFPKRVDAVAIGNADGSQTFEVLIGAEKMHVIDYEAFTKSLVDFQPNETLHKKGFKHIETGNFYRNNYPDILVVTSDNMIHVTGANRSSFRYLSNSGKSTYTLERFWALDPGCNIETILTIQLDDDEELEILVGCDDKKLIRIDERGKVTWQYMLQDNIADFKYADMDDDDVEDLLLLTKSGSIYMLNTKGDFIWKYDTGIDGRKLAVGDLTGNGLPEVTVVDKDTRMVSYSINETYILRKKADNLFHTGQEYYIIGDYENAEKTLVDARDIYYRIKYELGVKESDRILSDIAESAIMAREKEAEILYDKAQQSFIEGDYDLSLNYAQQARKIFEEFGDSEGALKCELLALRIKQVKEEDFRGDTMPTLTTTTLGDLTDSGFNIIYVAGAGVALIILIVVVIKVRGGKGEDESLELGFDRDEWGEI